MPDADFAWVEQTMTLDAIDPAVKAIDANPGWRLLGVGVGSGGQTTLTYGWPWATADTGHTSHSCGCGHHWDSHMAVVGGCSSCTCKAYPPNQPPAQIGGTDDA